LDPETNGSVDHRPSKGVVVEVEMVVLTVMDVRIGTETIERAVSVSSAVIETTGDTTIGTETGRTAGTGEGIGTGVKIGQEVEAVGIGMSGGMTETTAAVVVPERETVEVRGSFIKGSITTMLRLLRV
jgi:hypothetical protein